MPLSTDVNLPKSHSAVFPDRCVRCGANPESGSLRIWTNSIGWWTVVFWMFGRGFAVRVPACRGCGWRIRLQRSGGLLVVLVVGALFMSFVWPNLDAFVPQSFRKLAAIGLMLLCLSPWFLWQMFFPPSIDITAYSDNVDYEFRDSDYAYEFAALNSEADWVKIE